MVEMMGASPFPAEQLIIDNSLAEAQGHSIPWKFGAPPQSSKFAFRTPEMFSPEETAAIDRDVAEGLANGTYLEVKEDQVAACLARRPVLQNDKYRIIDNARPVNLFMDESLCSVKYEDLRWARSIAAPYMTKIDLRKGYRQVRLSAEAKPFFCFLWRGKLHQFQVMAFGDASAPQGFTKFMKGFALRWRRMGILCIIYLDDILIAAHSFERWLWSVQRAILDLCQCHVRIGVEKLFLGPFDCLEFLGVFVDYRAASLFVSDSRLSTASKACAELLAQETTQVREVQVLLGHLSFFSAAHQGLSLFRRALDLWVAEHSEEETATLTLETRGELDFFREALPTWAHRSFKLLPFANCTVVTDAAEEAWAGIVVSGGAVLFAAFDPLPPELIGSSSLARELFALLSFFRLCKDKFNLADRRVQVQMDNKGASFLVKKSKAKSKDTIEIMRELLNLQEYSNTYLVVDWRERTDNLISLVDSISKLQPPYEKTLTSSVLSAVFSHQGPPRDSRGKSEWSLSKGLFDSVCEWAWGRGERPDVDLFATAFNRQTPSFCSRFFSPDSLGNAFSLDWSGRRLYAFPPFSQIPNCLEKLSASNNLSLLLITKFDRASPAWPLLLNLNPTKKREIRREKVTLCSGGEEKSHPPFDLVVFLFVR